MFAPKFAPANEAVQAATESPTGCAMHRLVVSLASPAAKEAHDAAEPHDTPRRTSPSSTSLRRCFEFEVVDVVERQGHVREAR